MFRKLPEGTKVVACLLYCDNFAMIPELPELLFQQFKRSYFKSIIKTFHNTYSIRSQCNVA